MFKILLFVGLLLVLVSTASFAAEISLYDLRGEAIAYINTEEENTIYLWDGDAVAYYEDGSIWGFNGKHLGWFDRSIITNHDGDIVGAIKGAVNMPYQPEGPKALQSFIPIKTFQEPELPPMPKKNIAWSITPLSVFLAAGKEE